LRQGDQRRRLGGRSQIGLAHEFRGRIESAGFREEGRFTIPAAERSWQANETPRLADRSRDTD
jgi:hypothetical protein